MRTIFWRVAYEDEQLGEILKSKALVLPDLSRWPIAKNKNEEKIVSELKVGHFVLMANFNPNNEIGTVKGVGKITKNDVGSVEVEWKRPIPSWSLTPNAQGGVQEWRNEGVFCFDAEPAKRYKLQALTSKLFTAHNK
ncbi:hypothetical protein [Shewanella woodyi]|uniref:EVE domain-containing protein n=1 Tax=Shewanella woodyi (strain ATCC 51908 / MS32) TaxID=392500 RepID=B1KKU7_SHEWM|nr:hypothetical protein [Shewanella woodyi]ACA88753.1 hypothetical protein Swoo_4502 [Shewanella woodyi ATCC 51908]